MARELAAIEAKFLKQCAAAKNEAVKKAAKEIQKDFQKKVFEQAILDYYTDYSPTIYKREKKPGGLYRAFKTTVSDSSGRIELEFDWDFNRLPQYQSKSPRHQSGDEWISRDDDDFDPYGEDNGIPEKGWIFENFMEGIHPRWFFAKGIGLVNDSAYFEPSWERIKKYKDDYIKSGDADDILIKHLKQQYKKYIGR